MSNLNTIKEDELEFSLQQVDNPRIQLTQEEELSSFIRDNDPALILRLGFHSANTFDPNVQPALQGGTEGATMRFPPESTDGPNAGLNVAIRRLGNFIDTHPWASSISIADLWTKASAGGGVFDWTLSGQTSRGLCFFLSLSLPLFRNPIWNPNSRL